MTELLLAQALAERNLGRALTDAEKAVDIVAIERKLAAVKALLVEEIEREKRRVVREHVAGRRASLEVTPGMEWLLRGLYEFGREQARGEIERLGKNTSTNFAEDESWRQQIARALSILRTRLAAITLRVEREVVEARFQEPVALGVVAREAERRVPGALDAASRILAPAFDAGLTDVYSAEAGLFTKWVYTAVLDGNTCDVCGEADGTEYDTLDAALSDMPDFGPNPECLGETRCRCRLLPST